MSRMLSIASLLLFLAPLAPAAETYEPVTQQQLQSKIPNFFYCDYMYEPEPGKRLWLRAINVQTAISGSGCRSQAGIRP